MTTERSDAHRISRRLTISNTKGLHARASAKLAALAETFDASITVSKEDICVDATSIMELLLLVASKGSEIDVVAEGDDAATAVDAIAALVESGFGETD